MKKLKIFLPSIALLVVLAFSITMGVYAATSATLTVTGTISFKSADIAAKIDGYINAKDASIEHTWQNYTESQDGIVINEDYTNAWDLTSETLTFDADGNLVLNFEITNKTTLPIYAYIADTTNGNLVTTTKEFKGTAATITATAGSVVTIPENSTASSMLTITFTYTGNVIRSEKVSIATLGWQVRLSKADPTTPTT